MRARELMSCPAVTCHVNDTLSVAAHLMWERDCGAIAVVNDEGRLTSMITDRDVCMAAYTQGKPLEDMLVSTAMARNLVCASADQTTEELERMMGKHQIRRIPIVDEAGTPVGIVSMADLAIESVRPASPIEQERITITLANIERPRARNGA